MLEVKSVTTKTPKHGAQFKEVRFYPNVLTAKNPLLSRYQSCKALKARAMAAADWINSNTEYRVNNTSADYPNGVRQVGRGECSDDATRDHAALIHWAESPGYGKEVDRG